MARQHPYASEIATGVDEAIADLEGQIATLRSSEWPFDIGPEDIEFSSASAGGALPPEEPAEPEAPRKRRSGGGHHTEMRAPTYGLRARREAQKAAEKAASAKAKTSASRRKKATPPAPQDETPASAPEQMPTNMLVLRSLQTRAKRLRQLQEWMKDDPELLRW